VSSAAQRWTQQLAAWAIPDDIVAAAPESPYGFPPEPFRRRAAHAESRDRVPTTVRAIESLPEGGTVLDVGTGGGATSLPLAGRASTIVGVDAQPDMLLLFEAAGRAANVRTAGVLGRWPDVEEKTPKADVVVCGHVAYNVADLASFVLALDRHAATRVVLELTDRHPLAWMGDLWKRFHGLARPDGPTVDDAVAVLEEVGLTPTRQDWIPGDEECAGGFDSREDAIALVRRRLCLTREFDDEIGRALGDRLNERSGVWSSGPVKRTVVTLWWNVRR
jgi:SAM-dependent methyltransferase